MEPILSARPIPNWQPSTPAILAEDFASVLGRHPAVVIHFWADWNGIDPLIDHSIQALTKQFQKRVAFFSCSTDAPQNRSLWDRLHIANLPTLIMFAHHRMPRLLVGNFGEAELAEEVETFLSLSHCYKTSWKFWKPSNSRSVELQLPQDWLEAL